MPFLNRNTWNYACSPFKNFRKVSVIRKAFTEPTCSWKILKPCLEVYLKLTDGSSVLKQHRVSSVQVVSSHFIYSSIKLPFRNVSIHSVLGCPPPVSVFFSFLSSLIKSVALPSTSFPLVLNYFYLMYVFIAKKLTLIKNNHQWLEKSCPN